MTIRTVTAESTGPVTLETALIGFGGVVTVRAEDGCDRARLTVETPEETGPAADAVREATLRKTSTGLAAHVEGAGASVAAGQSVTGVTMISHGNSGSVIQVGGNLVSGDVWVNGVRITAGTGGGRVRIIAVVPPGSSVTARTQSADVGTFGPLEAVRAVTQSGDVHIERAADITVSTQSGDVDLDTTDVAEVNTMSGDITIADFGGTARLKTMSGDVRVHATTGGAITATTMSGDITVTATHAATGDDLDVQAHTMSGRLRTPSTRSAGGPRRRRD